MDSKSEDGGVQIKDSSPKSKRKAYRKLIKDRGDDPAHSMKETKAEIMESAMARILTRPITEVADFSKCKKLQGGKGNDCEDGKDSDDEGPKDAKKRNRKHTPAQLRRVKKKKTLEMNKPVLPDRETVQRRRMDYLTNALRPAPSFSSYIRLQ